MSPLANTIRLIYADPFYFGKNRCENAIPADLYAFGLLLVEIFTLRLPFQDNKDSLGIEWTEFLTNKFTTRKKVDMLQIGTITAEEVKLSVISCIRDPIDRPSMKWVNKKLNVSNPHKQGNNYTFVYYGLILITLFSYSESRVSKKYLIEAPSQEN